MESPHKVGRDAAVPQGAPGRENQKVGYIELAMTDRRVSPEEPRTTTLGLTLAARALTLRCPACGSRRIFSTWFTLVNQCPRCALRLHHGPHDHFVGTTLVNFLVAEMGWAILFTIYLVWSWPNPAWDALTWASAAFMVVLPVMLYRFTRICWLTVDFFFRPGGEGERTDVTPTAP